MAQIHQLPAFRLYPPPSISGLERALTFINGGILWMVYRKRHLAAIASCIVLLFIAVMDHDLLPNRARPVLLLAGLAALVGLAWRNLHAPEDSTKP
jgi:hypothetical protein